VQASGVADVQLQDVERRACGDCDGVAAA
jgi:hypothetical protein